MPMRLWHGLVLAACALPSYAQTGSCNDPGPNPSVTVNLPGSPFAVAPSADGCLVFVSLSGSKDGVAVLTRDSGHLEVSRIVPVTPGPAGLALTHDGKLLIVAASNKVIFLDVERMVDGSADPVVGSLPATHAPNFRLSIYVNVTSDDRLLFVSEESGSSITVVDLDRARRSGFGDDAIIGDVPTGSSPIALTFSPDRKWLYTTSEVASPAWQWPNACTREGSGNPEIVKAEGAVVVVDVARAGTDPANAAVARIPSGCSAVRAAISPEGGRLFVTARNSDAVLAFDTTRLVSDPQRALLGKMPVGAAPVPVAVVDGGKKVIAGNSNRFAGAASPESLTVLDASKVTEGRGAVLGTIPAGAFPREMRVSADGHTLFLTNAGSHSLQVMDVARMADILQPLP